MKKIFMAMLTVVIMLEVSNGSFIYEEIDPICSISGTTHTSFPGEISDTSGWNIPTAYDGECDELEALSPDDRKEIYAIVIEYLDTRGYLVEAWTWYSLTVEGEKYLQDEFFEEVKEFIPENRDNTRSVAILNDAVSMIGYDYFIKWSESVEYLGLTETEAEGLAITNGVPFRIGGRDGELFGVTADFVPGRITAIIEDWIVIDYSIEG